MFLDKYTDELLDNIEIEEGTASTSDEITYDVSGKENKTNENFQYIYIDKKWHIEDLNIE